jgi:hypothetical protein
MRVDDFFFILIVFALIVVALVLFFLSFIRLSQLPPADTLAPDPNVVACSEDDILEAYIRGYPSRESCPPFTNNYVVGDDFNMYEKFFQVDSVNDCCWYSNEVNQRELFPNPWICNGLTVGQFTLNELNVKPYFFDGVTTFYPNPSCDENPNCISMIRAGLQASPVSGPNPDTGSTPEESSLGIYKVTKFRTESTNTYEGGAIPQPDTSADYARRLNFLVGESCGVLQQIYLDDQLLMDTNAAGQRIWFDQNPAARPLIVNTIVEIFDRERFFPIPGANPPLTISAMNYI